MVTLEIVCLAGIGFLVVFLLALSRDEKRR